MEVMGLNPVEALIFSAILFPITQIGKFTAVIILHFHLQPQFKYYLFHIYFTSQTVMLEIFQIRFISQIKFLWVCSWLLEIRFCSISEAWNPFVMFHRATFLYVSFLSDSHLSLSPRFSNKAPDTLGFYSCIN